MQYQLSLNEKQARVMKDALEEYFRIRMNQWNHLAENLAMKGVDFSQTNPKHKEIMNCYLTKREDLQIVLESAGAILGWNHKTEASEEDRIAQDIWQVLRHQLWKDFSTNKDPWCVDSREPLPMSDEPLPSIKVTEK